MSKSKKPYYLTPDIIRFILLLLLIIFHLHPPILKHYYIRSEFIEKFFALNTDNLIVSGFIILSGFVTFKSTPQTNLKFYIKKVFTRIFPVYWLTLIISILLNITDITSPTEFPIIDTTSILCSLTATCAYFHRWGGPFLATSWFLGLYLALQLTYPLILKLINAIGKSNAILLLGFISILFRSEFIADPNSYPLRALNWHPISRLLEFVIGINLAHVIPNKWLRPLKNHQTIKILKYFSKLGLPIFLIHYPLLFIYQDVFKNNHILGFIALVGSTLATSALIQYISNKIT